MSACDILLIAVNARYAHASYAIRTLHANLGPLASRTQTLEADLTVLPLQLAEAIAERAPRIAAYSTYLWNTGIITQTLAILRQTHPHIRHVLGGPQITPETLPHYTPYAHALIIGEGETALRTWAQHTLDANDLPTAPQIIHAQPENLDTLILPHDYYTDQDLAQRITYTEASRGCPHPCTYCTHARTPLRTIPLPTLIDSWQKLMARGVRTFKFLDRSYNAHLPHATAILDYFLSLPTPHALHLELHPNNLPDTLKQRLAAYPKGQLHLEIGLQTLNPAIAQTIGRPADTATALANTAWLANHTGADIHADLIYGLPGQTIDNFADDFNQLLAACRPAELQVNQLKRLPGTQLAAQQHPGTFYNPNPPYEVLQTSALTFDQIARLRRFARCWELLHNRGQHADQINQLLNQSPSPYHAIQTLADALHQRHGKLYALSRAQLSQTLADALTGNL